MKTQTQTFVIKIEHKFEDDKDKLTNQHDYNFYLSSYLKEGNYTIISEEVSQ